MKKEFWKRRLLAVAMAAIMMIPQCVYANEGENGNSTIQTEGSYEDVVKNAELIGNNAVSNETNAEDVTEAIPATENIIYVSSNGDDNHDGKTEETAFASLAKAVEEATDGAKIMICSDLTVDTSITIDKSVSIEGKDDADGNKPIISYSNTPQQNSFSIFLVEKNDISLSIEGINFDGSSIDMSSDQELYGGVLRVEGDQTSVNIQKCQFTEFEAREGGIVFYPSNSAVDLTVKDSHFIKNRTTKSGGAISSQMPTNVKMHIDNCIFEENSSGSYGGAILIMQGRGNIDIVIENSEFQKNECTKDDGGAIDIHGASRNWGGNIHLRNVNFKENKAENDGGAISVGTQADINLQVENVQFIDNISKGAGGAICLSSGKLNTTINGTTIFKNNSANAQDEPGGNAIAFAPSSIAGAEPKTGLYATDGAFFYHNFATDQELKNQAAIVVFSQGNNDPAYSGMITLPNYMPDGTKLRWNIYDEAINGLREPSKEEYDGEISGNNRYNGLELYLNEDMDESLLPSEDDSNVFAGNQAKYGGAIFSYGALNIGTPGKEIEIHKKWQDNSAEHPDHIVVDLIRANDKQVIDKIKVTEGNGWKATISDFPENVNYSITEPTIEGFIGTVSSEGDVWTIINKPDNDTNPDDSSSGGGGYTSNTYWVRYHNDGDTERDGKFIPGETVTVRGDIFTAPRGKVLAGWSLEENGKVDYKVGDTFRMPGSSYDLYAVWKDAETMTHTAYISGYPDGTVGPDRTITRAEAATMFYNLLSSKNSTPRTFVDVPMNQWYANAVTSLAGMGVINGYPDGTFKPDAPITRAEFVTMAMNFAKADKGAACGFADVSENMWYYNAIAGATENGWISGYPDGTFGPDRYITRAEVTSVINRMENRAADMIFIVENLNDLHTFSDLSFQHWAYGSMMEAANGHNYTREQENTYEVWTEIK